MRTSNNPQFNRYYEQHCKHLRLKGPQPITVDAYTRALRRIGDYFNFQVDNLDQDQLLDYFHALLKRLSWNAVSSTQRVPPRSKLWLLTSQQQSLDRAIDASLSF